MDRPSRGFSIGGVDRVDKRLHPMHPPRTIPTFDLSIEVPDKTPSCLMQVEPRPHRTGSPGPQSSLELNFENLVNEKQLLDHNGGVQSYQYIWECRHKARSSVYEILFLPSKKSAGFGNKRRIRRYKIQCETDHWTKCSKRFEMTFLVRSSSCSVLVNIQIFSDMNHLGL